MKKYAVIMQILIKRQCKNKAFIGMLILLCVLLAAAPFLSGLFGDDTIYVALYSEDEDLGLKVIKDLKEAQGSYVFYECESRKALIEDVKSLKAAAGYVFTAGFSDGIINQDYRGIVNAIYSEEDVVGEMISETVFAEVFSYMSLYTADNYLNDKLQGTLAQDQYDFKAVYNEYISTGKVFSVEFCEISDEKDDSTDTLAENVSTITGEDLGTTFKFSFRNIMSIFIMAAGALGGYEWLTDSQKGTFDTVGLNVRRLISLLYCLIPTLMAGIISLTGIIIMGRLNLYGIEQADLIKELCSMLGYVILVALVMRLLSGLLTNAQIYGGVCTVIIMMSIIICPVIMDIAPYVPAFRTLRKFFIPYYYINIF